uniref:hypothetical protein n=1 Tax=Eubacterium cellulosolvens TaxID=29322 RepID=UPI00047F8F08|nr:hypothetical protein [[Eubacterium] cellulosolvens]
MEIKLMEFETMLNSIKGSFLMEGMDMPDEVETNIRAMENGTKTLDECIMETIQKYSSQATTS